MLVIIKVNYFGVIEAVCYVVAVIEFKVLIKGKEVITDSKCKWQEYANVQFGSNTKSPNGLYKSENMNGNHFIQ